MKTIITPAEAISLGWSAGEYAAPETVAESDIAAAEQRYIIPVIGRALAEALAEGRYESLRSDYAAPALALYVRVSVQQSLDIRTGQCGSVVQRGTCCEPASAEARRSALRSLRRRADALLRRMSEHLDSESASYPEYDARHNILKRCMTDGGIVQIF